MERTIRFKKLGDAFYIHYRNKPEDGWTLALQPTRAIMISASKIISDNNSTTWSCADPYFTTSECRQIMTMFIVSAASDGYKEFVSTGSAFLNMVTMEIIYFDKSIRTAVE